VTPDSPCGPNAAARRWFGPWVTGSLRNATSQTFRRRHHIVQGETPCSHGDAAVSGTISNQQVDEAVANVGAVTAVVSAQSDISIRINETITGVLADQAEVSRRILG